MYFSTRYVILYVFFIFQALQPVIRREFSHLSVEPLKVFWDRVRKNLHIILSCRPTDDLLIDTLRFRQYM